MEEEIKKIIREEFDKVMSKKYSEDDVRDAIMNKHFIHALNGKVYCPVEQKDGLVLGVDSESQHVNIPLGEIALIQSAEDRFGGR